MMQTAQRSERLVDPATAEVFYGYCNRTQRFRMMGFDEYLDNVREGMQRMWGEPETGGARWPGGESRTRPGHDRGRRHRGRHRHGDHCCGGCGGHDACDCRCECCVCDADVLVHARCGERRRISITFENDTRREREVKLTLGDFSTAGGSDLGWTAKLSATEFTLRGCEEKTVVLDVQVDCGKLLPPQDEQPAAGRRGSTAPPRERTLDRCVVGYATVRAEGCLTRPVVVAVAVLPDDCDAYAAHCGCNCCC